MDRSTARILVSIRHPRSYMSIVAAAYHPMPIVTVIEIQRASFVHFLVQYYQLNIGLKQSFAPRLALLASCYLQSPDVSDLPERRSTPQPAVQQLLRSSCWHVL